MPNRIALGECRESIPLQAPGPRLREAPTRAAHILASPRSPSRPPDAAHLYTHRAASLHRSAQCTSAVPADCYNHTRGGRSSTNSFLERGCPYSASNTGAANCSDSWVAVLLSHRTLGRPPHPALRAKLRDNLVASTATSDRDDPSWGRVALQLSARCSNEKTCQTGCSAMPHCSPWRAVAHGQPFHF